ncbi:MAG TPA: hypothetical protein VLA09_07540 [Longimicrobiales bacterium]|nr:hypothetical protein [Longimicrobiales bacterium]
MRFRKDGADCLFNHHNYYDNPMSLNTDAEMTVTDAVWVGPGRDLQLPRDVHAGDAGGAEGRMRPA